jgi:hypothetical protein
VINGTNLLSEDNPRWPIGNTAETTKLLAIGPAQLAAPRRGPFRVRVPGICAWIARMPGGLGTWLFQRNDAEAGWRNWQITQIRGGLARGYRDSRFDVLRQLHDLLTQRGTEPSGAEPRDE